MDTRLEALQKVAKRALPSSSLGSISTPHALEVHLQAWRLAPYSWRFLLIFLI